MLASVASMIEQFNMSNIALLQSMGYVVDVACNFQKGNTFGKDISNVFMEKLKALHVCSYQIDFNRNVFHLGENLRALNQVRKLVKENNYTFIHCHSPIGGLVGRIVGHRYGVKVVYTAHGFHFFRGAPIKNWLIFYPIEKYYSKYTDVLITINQEDFARAKNKFYAKKVEYVHGVGVDTTKFCFDRYKEEKKPLKEELGFSADAIWFLSIGELNKNKNHKTVIKSLGAMISENPRLSNKVFYTVAGVGKKKGELEGLAAKLDIQNNVKFLGFRRDVAKLYGAADVFVMPSHREGLSLALMEAMASGLPCAVSRIRGNTDLIDENGGRLFDSYSVDECARSLTELCEMSSEIRKKYGLRNVVKMKEFNIETVSESMRKVYSAL